MAATCYLVTGPGYTGVSLRPLLDTVQDPLPLACPSSTLQASELDLGSQRHSKSCSLLGGGVPDQVLFPDCLSASGHLPSSVVCPCALATRESRWPISSQLQAPIFSATMIGAEVGM